MKWTHEQPKTPGWYWVGKKYYDDPYLYDITIISVISFDDDHNPYVFDDRVGISRLDKYCDMDITYFAGPIPEPERPEDEQQ